MSYDGKRDRWNGYDPSQHKAIIEEYQKVEDAKRELRAKKLEEGKLIKMTRNKIVFVNVMRFPSAMVVSLNVKLRAYWLDLRLWHFSDKRVY